MKIGILQTGDVHPSLVNRHGEYADMFKRLLNDKNPDFTFEVFLVLNEIYPESVNTCDGWIVTGSRHGTYEDHPWIEPLKQFIQKAYAASVPMIGICFGHQIMADALGGKNEKSNKGWGCGMHEYQLKNTPSWMNGVTGNLRIHAMHQDQVTIKPDDANVFATSEFCENAGFIYGDLETPKAISLQPHPEFNDDFERDVIKLRRGDGIPEDVADGGLNTIGGDLSSGIFAKWMVDFFLKYKP